MKRLLSINNYHYRRGGSDVMYFNHAELMQSCGFQNAYFSMHHPRNMACEWSEFFIDELEFGEKYTPLEKIKRAAKSIYNLEAQKKLTKLLDNYPAHIAHLHCIYHHLSPAILPTLRQRNIPTVMTAHDLKIACPAYKMLNSGGICEACKGGSYTNLIKNRCIKDSLIASSIVAIESTWQRHRKYYRDYIDKIVVPSQFFLKKFMEWGWPEEKFCYIPNYVDTKQLQPNYEPGSYLLYFGRLSSEKGVHTLIRASAKARAKVVIAGTGPEYESLKKLAQSLDAQCDFVGYRSGENLIELIRNCRAVVLPSEWYENAPMSILESMAIGKPTIGSRIGGIPELISERGNGLLFESGSIEGLTEQLINLANMTPSTIREMGANAREIVSNQYSPRRYVENIMKLYSNLGVRANDAA